MNKKRNAKLTTSRFLMILLFSAFSSAISISGYLSSLAIVVMNSAMNKEMYRMFEENSL